MDPKSVSLDLDLLPDVHDPDLNFTCVCFLQEEVSREIEEKKEELRPKVLKIYNVCSEETQSAVRNPAPEVWVKNHSNADNINKFLENLVKIGTFIFRVLTFFFPSMHDHFFLISTCVQSRLSGIQRSVLRVDEAHAGAGVELSYIHLQKSHRNSTTCGETDGGSPGCRGGVIG